MADKITDFEVAPPAPADSPRWQPRSGDNVRVFTVAVGEYENRRIVAVFVANRAAACRYAVEYNRYLDLGDAAAEVESYLDYAESGWGEVRQYPTPYTRVEFATCFKTDGRVFSRVATTTVEQDNSHAIVDATAVDGGSTDRTRFIRVVTNGPDFKLDELRQQHLAKADQVRASLTEKETAAVYVYDGVGYNLRVEYVDSAGGKWRFTGELEDTGVPFMRRVGDNSDRRQDRTLSDVEVNWGPLRAASSQEGKA